MSFNRWQQIKRYLKLSSYRTDPPPSSDDFLARVGSILNRFRQACMRYVRPGRDVSIDEQLIACKARCRWTMNIAAKAAKVGFKIYSLCSENYLLDFRFSAKQIGIENVQKWRDLPVTSMVVVRLLEGLPKPWEYVVFVDNFFTRSSLFLHLKKLGFGACGTAKSNSGFPAVQVALKQISQKSQHWGFRTIAMSENAEILNLTWQDNNTVMMMTTAHNVSDCYHNVMLNPYRRKNIPQSSYEVIEGLGALRALPFPQPVVDYNKHMGGSDGNAQLRAQYSCDHHGDRRYWWKLFHFVIHAAIVNAYIVYKLDWPESKLCRREFQRQIALHFIRNPAGQQRQQPYDFGNTMPKSPLPPHRWRRTDKKGTCTACSKAKRGRPALHPVDRNIRRTARPSQSRWGCVHPACKGRYACKNERCWNGMSGMHMRQS